MSYNKNIPYQEWRKDRPCDATATCFFGKVLIPAVWFNFND